MEWFKKLFGKSKDEITSAVASLPEEARKKITDALDEFSRAAEAEFAKSGGEDKNVDSFKSALEQLTATIKTAVEGVAKPVEKSEAPKLGLDADSFAKAVATAVSEAVKPLTEKVAAIETSAKAQGETARKAEIKTLVEKGVKRGAIKAGEAAKWEKRLTDNFEVWNVALGERDDNATVAKENEKGASDGNKDGNKDGKDGKGGKTQEPIRSGWLRSQNPAAREYVDKQLADAASQPSN